MALKVISMFLFSSSSSSSCFASATPKYCAQEHQKRIGEGLRKYWALDVKGQVQILKDLPSAVALIPKKDGYLLSETINGAGSRALNEMIRVAPKSRRLESVEFGAGPRILASQKDEVQPFMEARIKTEYIWLGDQCVPSRRTEFKADGNSEVIFDVKFCRDFTATLEATPEIQFINCQCPSPEKVENQIADMFESHRLPKLEIDKATNRWFYINSRNFIRAQEILYHCNDKIPGAKEFLKDSKFWKARESEPIREKAPGAIDFQWDH